MPLHGATTDENNRPPLDKEGLKGGGAWKFRKPPPDPLLSARRGNVIFRGGDGVCSARSLIRIQKKTNVAENDRTRKQDTVDPI